MKSSSATVEKRINEGRFQGSVLERPVEKYHLDRAYFSSTELKLVPVGGVAALQRSRSTESGGSNSMKLGSAVHSMLLEPEKKAVMVDPEEIPVPRGFGRKPLAKDQKTLDDPRFQKKQSEYESWLETYAKLKAIKNMKFQGKILLTPSEFDLVTRVVEKIRDDSCVGSMFTKLKGRSEVSVYSECPDTGLNIRCRFDKVFPILNTGIDLKTTSAKNVGEFKRDCLRYGYIYSMAHYALLGSLHYGEGFQMRIVAVQMQEPHEIWPVKFTHEDLEVAADRLTEAKFRVKEAVETGVWDAKISDFIEIEMPAYFRQGVA